MKSPHFEVFLKRILYYSPTLLLALLARVFASKCTELYEVQSSYKSPQFEVIEVFEVYI